MNIPNERTKALFFNAHNVDNGVRVGQVQFLQPSYSMGRKPCMTPSYVSAVVAKFPPRNMYCKKNRGKGMIVLCECSHVSEFTDVRKGNIDNNLL